MSRRSRPFAPLASREGSREGRNIRSGLHLDSPVLVDAGFGTPRYPLAGRWRSCGLAVVLATLLGMGGIAARAQADVAADVLIEAAGFIAPDGKIVRRPRVLVQGGRIAAPDADAPHGVAVHSYPPGAVVSAGLIDCAAAIGAQGGLAERGQAVQPAIRAADAFNRYSYQLARACKAGVTAFALAPDDSHLIGGQIAICLTAGGRPGRPPALLTADGPVHLSLAPDAFMVDREPTSRGGAVSLLRTTVQRAREAKAAGPLAEFARGQRAGILAAPSGADVLTAVELSQTYGLRLAVKHTDDAHLVAESLTGKLAGVIVGPLDFSASPRTARAAGLLEAQKIPVAIAGGLPQAPPDSLRIGAAVAARAGLSAEAARRAITLVPAELLGVADTIGSIESGKRGDLVVFSGDPLDLRSRVLAVYVGGVRVFAASPSGAEEAQP